MFQEAQQDVNNAWKHKPDSSEIVSDEIMLGGLVLANGSVRRNEEVVIPQQEFAFASSLVLISELGEIGRSPMNDDQISLDLSERSHDLRIQVDYTFTRALEFVRQSDTSSLRE